MARYQGSTGQGLRKMPNEMVRFICEALHSDDYDYDYQAYQADKGALCALSRTCWRFHAIVQPILFSSFVYHDRRSATDLLRFLRSLDNNAQLHQHIKILEFSPRIRKMQHDLSCDGLEEFRARCFAAIPEATISEAAISRDYLGEREYGVVGVELALLRTPKLHTLRLPTLFNPPGLAILPKLQLAGALLPKLHTLRLSRIAALPRLVDTDARLIVAHLTRQAPNLRSLAIASWVMTMGQSFGWQPLPLLTSLTLGPRCWASAELIFELIALSPTLRVFRLHAKRNFTTAAEIWGAVATRSDALEELSLFQAMDHHVINGGNNNTPDWQTLSGFAKLKILRLSQAFARVLLEAWQLWLGEIDSNNNNNGLLLQFLPPGIEEFVLWNIHTPRATRWTAIIEELAKAIVEDNDDEGGRFGHLGSFW